MKEDVKLKEKTSMFRMIDSFDQEKEALEEKSDVKKSTI